MTAPTLISAEAILSQKRTLWQDAVRSFKKNRLAIAGLVVVAVFFIMAIFADVLTPYAYYKADLGANLQFPSAAHPFGTDAIGRDVLSLIIYGARTSLLVGFSVQLIAFAIGLPLGALAGLRGGWIDFVITRILEVMTAFPNFLFAIFLMSILGTGVAQRNPGHWHHQLDRSVPPDARSVYRAARA